MFSFTVDGSRLTTSPVTSITYSERSVSSISVDSLCSWLTTTLTILEASLNSIKINPPRSRRRWFHPLKVTVSLSLSNVSNTNVLLITELSPQNFQMNILLLHQKTYF